MVNYACHPVSLGGGNRLLSPDYIGAMREVVERDTGGAMCVFMHGASGDLTPRRSYEAKAEVADQNGRELGYAALSVLSGMFPPGQELQYKGVEESGTPLGIWRLTPRSDVSEQLSGRFVTTAISATVFSVPRGTGSATGRHDGALCDRAAGAQPRTPRPGRRWPEWRLSLYRLADRRGFLGVHAGGVLQPVPDGPAAPVRRHHGGGASICRTAPRPICPCRKASAATSIRRASPSISPMPWRVSPRWQARRSAICNRVTSGRSAFWRFIALSVASTISAASNCAAPSAAMAAP